MQCSSCIINLLWNFIIDILISSLSKNLHWNPSHFVWIQFKQEHLVDDCRGRPWSHSQIVSIMAMFKLNMTTMSMETKCFGILEYFQLLFLFKSWMCRLFPSGKNHYKMGTEVFNSYGRRPNENLLQDYGFAMLDNEWEEVRAYLKWFPILLLLKDSCILYVIV